jgi:uncharacterized protein (DUF342 family)
VSYGESSAFIESEIGVACGGTVKVAKEKIKSPARASRIINRMRYPKRIIGKRLKPKISGARIGPPKKSAAAIAKAGVIPGRFMFSFVWQWGHFT